MYRGDIVRKRILFVLTLIIAVVPLVSCEFYSKDEKELIQFVEDFYEVQYDAYTELEYMDIEDYLDMSRIQNRNKVIALKKLIIQRKHMDEMKYCYIHKKKYPVEMDILNVNINGDYASLDIDVELIKDRHYPVFISEGENIFALKKMDGNWKIVNHDYDGLEFFETSYRDLLPENDEERIKRIIDNEYGESPFS